MQGGTEHFEMAFTIMLLICSRHVTCTGTQVVVILVRPVGTAHFGTVESASGD